MNRLAITSAALLLGGGLATAGSLRAQSQKEPQYQNQTEQTQNQNNYANYANNANGPEIIIIHGGQASDQFGNLVLQMPQNMDQDAVIVDGARVGTAGNISELELLPGSHELTMCAPDGQIVYQHNVGVAAGEVTDVTPTEAELATNQAAQYPAAQPSVQPNQSAAAVANNTPQPYSASAASLPPAPANSGNLKLDTPSDMKDDAVFINGTYAGIAKTIKNVPLAAGTYNVALCAPNGGTDYQGDVNISANKTTKIRSVLNG